MVVQNKGIKEGIKDTIKIVRGLEVGREKSMYVDVLDDGTVTVPNSIVTEKNAEDATRLAAHALKSTIEYISSNNPYQFSRLEDKFLEVSKEKATKILEEEDFWEYYVDQVTKNPQANFTEYLIKYREEYFCTKRKYIVHK